MQISPFGERKRERTKLLENTDFLHKDDNIIYKISLLKWVLGMSKIFSIVVSLERVPNFLSCFTL